MQTELTHIQRVNSVVFDNVFLPKIPLGLDFKIAHFMVKGFIQLGNLRGLLID